MYLSKFALFIRATRVHVSVAPLNSGSKNGAKYFEQVLFTNEPHLILINLQNRSLPY